jgi:hypothetical protein
MINAAKVEIYNKQIEQLQSELQAAEAKITDLQARIDAAEKREPVTHVIVRNVDISTGNPESVCKLQSPLYTHPAIPPEGMMLVDDDTIDAVTKAMRRSWQLGQIYWQQVDSESYKQNAKSVETLAKFDTLIDETISMLKAVPAKGE